MSITDELREYFKTTTSFPAIFKELTDIADRIDEQAEADMCCEYTHGYTAGFSEASDGCEAADELRERMEREYIKMPVDADGVPIHIGDTMEWLDGSTAEVIGIGNGVFFYKDDESDGADWSSSENKHHAKPDSWERIIQDAVKLGYADYPTTFYEAELVKRCKKLAGE